MDYISFHLLTSKIRAKQCISFFLHTINGSESKDFHKKKAIVQAHGFQTLPSLDWGVIRSKTSEQNRKKWLCLNLVNLVLIDYLFQIQKIVFEGLLYLNQTQNLVFNQIMATAIFPCSVISQPRWSMPQWDSNNTFVFFFHIQMKSANQTGFQAPLYTAVQ